MPHALQLTRTAAQRTRLAITVHGLPAPQGSKRHVGGGVMVEASKLVKPWRQDVVAAALAALELQPDWDRQLPRLALYATFTLPRPRNHYRTGRFSHLLRDDAPQLHGVKPDLDKLLRSTCDALTTAGVYADDSRVARIHAMKCYPTVAGLPVHAMDHPGAWLLLTPVGAP